MPDTLLLGSENFLGGAFRPSFVCSLRKFFCNDAWWPDYQFFGPNYQDRPGSRTHVETNALGIMSTWQPQGASRLPPGAYTLGPQMINCWQTLMGFTCQ